MHYILQQLPAAFIQNLGPWEIGLIVLLALLLFGGKKLPELARGAGRAIKEFKEATSDAEKTFKDALKETPPEKPKDSVATAEKTTPARDEKASRQS